MQKVIKMKPIKLDNVKEKEKWYNRLRELFSKRFENYFDEYSELLDVKKRCTKHFKPKNLKLEDFDYD